MHALGNVSTISFTNNPNPPKTTHTFFQDPPPRSQYVHWRMYKDDQQMLRGGITFKMQWMPTSESWKVSIAACHTTDTWCRKKGAAIATIKMIDGEWFKVDSPFRDARTDIMFYVNEMFLSTEPPYKHIPPGVRSTMKKVWKSQ